MGHWLGWLSVALLACGCRGQKRIVEPPKAFSLGLSVNEKYSANRFDFTPQVTFEYRVLPALRTGISVGRSTAKGDLSVSGSVSVKVLQWGRKR